ncbi:hypothetical protein [Xenorhabdus bovienii]|uniref:hypothetical protein n=1 Tax=Xenorhabdus bovienii TaxID=40576 RepID=UPI00237D2B2D|nr:hypothetical protein [Xenorhabdus bovienii]MDE1475853.1 hypothetical protein [Xenorhabdus bovienii]MDE1483793.1 hypothetical protein [Xenorhabdus bovienii]MDE9430458.1 hypothetical protein [Xenorhabdus bovienii]
MNTKTPRKNKAQEELSLSYVSILDVLSNEQDHIEHIHVTDIPPNEADRFLLVELPKMAAGEFDVRDFRIALLSALNATTTVKRNLSSRNITKLDINIPADLLGNSKNEKVSRKTSNKKDRIETLKNAILENANWLSSRALSKFASFSSSNPSATPNRWKKAKKIFAISVKGKDFYPQYALDEGGLPLPIMKNIIELFDEKKTSWGIAIWFGTPNAWLGKAKPKDVLMNRPGDVLLAARQEAEGPLHG